MKSFVAVMIVLSLMLCVGCSNTGPEKTAESIQDTRTAVVKAQGDLNETISALDALGNSKDNLNPAYDRFKTALANTKEQKKVAEDRAVEMRKDEAAYQKKWESDASMINDPAVKSSADQRIADRRAKYGEMRDVALDCRKQYAMLYTDLLDINQYLSNDLTPAGIEKLKPQIEKAKQDAALLNTRMNDLTAKMDAFSADGTASGTGSMKS